MPKQDQDVAVREYRDYCPKCDAVQPTIDVYRIEKVELDGVVFEAPATLGICTVCGEEFHEVGVHLDHLENIYAQYEEKFGHPWKGENVPA